MTIKKFFFFFLIVCLALLGIHVLLSQTLLAYSLSSLFTFDGVVIALFALGSLMALPMLKGDGENFVMRFMVLTTFQFLGGLILMASIIFSKVDDFRTIAMHTISMFVALLFAQSILLLTIIRK